ncbi:MAG: BrnA antitoxin family protein [Pseudomonadota bacterium]|nr:BrnA antitoxin family protein [Pseudomonadota bacterium]
MSDWIDPDDAPILTAEIAARAEIRQDGKVIRPATGTLTRMGRPPLGKAAKKQVTLRLDSEVVEAFRAGGAGWQSRMNEALRKAVQA